MTNVQHLGLFSPFYLLSVDLAPLSDLGDFGIFGKLLMHTFKWYKVCGSLSSVHEIAVFGIRAARVISLLAVRFLVKVSCNSKMLLTNRDNQVVENLVYFEKLLAFWTTAVRIGKILRAKAASKLVFFCQKYLIKFYRVLCHFFIISAITYSFQICFEPVNYRSEDLLTHFNS